MSFPQFSDAEALASPFMAALYFKKKVYAFCSFVAMAATTC
jgi:hypothetical protein